MIVLQQTLIVIQKQGAWVALALLSDPPGTEHSTTQKNKGVLKDLDSNDVVEDRTTKEMSITYCELSLEQHLLHEGDYNFLLCWL